MKKEIMMEKYPVFTLNIGKDETTYDSVDKIIEYFKAKIEAHHIASYIGVFDHFSHTKALPTGELNPDIKDAKNILFCFGEKLLDPKMLALRPRSIGVAEYQNQFTISFMEAPVEAMNALMQEWAQSVTDREDA